MKDETFSILAIILGGINMLVASITNNIPQAILGLAIWLGMIINLKNSR